MTSHTRTRRRQARPRVRLLHAYVALRNAEQPAQLGQIDWLLWGTRENPYTPGSRPHQLYNAAFDTERRRTPNPTATRIKRKP